MYVVVVWARALHGDPMPIPHVYQHLPPHVRAVCFIQADIYAQVVCLHARQGKARFILKLHLATNTA